MVTLGMVTVNHVNVTCMAVSVQSVIQEQVNASAKLAIMETGMFLWIWHISLNHARLIITALDSSFKSYFCSRSQYLSVNGQNSSYLTVSYGAPHGSVLDPVLLLLHINDLPNTLTNLLTTFSLMTLVSSLNRTVSKCSKKPLAKN